MNESIESIVMDCIPEELTLNGEVVTEQMRERLREQLLFRDNEVLDQLRMLAAGQGLMPGMTAYLLMSVGLGEAPTEEEMQLHRRQAEAEYRAMLEQMGFQVVEMPVVEPDPATPPEGGDTGGTGGEGSD